PFFIFRADGGIRDRTVTGVQTCALPIYTKLDTEQHEYVATIRESGDALLTIINDILDFSKIEAGRMDIEAQPFDLRECVESALEDRKSVVEGESVCVGGGRLRAIVARGR